MTSPDSYPLGTPASNAAVVVGVVRSLGLPEAAALIAVMVVLDESSGLNIGYGDINKTTGLMTTSRGLYQQKAEWGPLADRMNPAAATVLFLKGGQAGQPGLLGIVNWAGMSPWIAAQAVQGSSVPDGSNYHARYDGAVALIAAVTKGLSMSLPLADAAGVLRAAGLTVVEMTGWSTRGETDGGFTPRGLILHHDAMGLGFNSSPSDDNNVPQYMGQSGVDGAQFWVSRRGVWWTMAAGRKWHAGLGQWNSIPTDSGNTFTAGVETDHTVGDPWEPAQFNAINLGCRALVQHYGWTVDQYCCGHREYAPTRKIDPDNIDLDAWRSFLKGKNTTPIVTTTSTSPPEPPATPTTPTDWFDMATQADLQAVITSPAVLDAFADHLLQRLFPTGGGAPPTSLGVAAGTIGKDTHATRLIALDIQAHQPKP